MVGVGGCESWWKVGGLGHQTRVPLYGYPRKEEKEYRGAGGYVPHRLYMSTEYPLFKGVV